MKLIVEATAPFKEFIKFLNNKNLCKIPCKIVLLPEHDAVKANGNIGFAVYGTSSQIMYVAGRFPPEDRFEIIARNIAHEYVHHIQNVTDKKFSEHEADEISDNLIVEYLS